MYEDATRNMILKLIFNSLIDELNNLNTEINYISMV